MTKTKHILSLFGIKLFRTPLSTIFNNAFWCELYNDVNYMLKVTCFAKKRKKIAYIFRLIKQLQKSNDLHMMLKFDLLVQTIQLKHMK